MLISARVAECIQEFRNLESRMVESGDATRITDQHMRFKIWMGDVVVTPNEEDGLDFRLRNGQDLLKHRVLDLLHDLRTELREGESEQQECSVESSTLGADISSRRYGQQRGEH